MAVIRAQRIPDPSSLASTLASAGIRAVEFTFTVPDVANVIRAAADSGALVGAGTVVTAVQAEEALAAGARFLVAPTLVPELLEVADETPVILGAFTPTEVQSATEAGAAAVKVFPARVGGPDYIRDLLAPFPHLSLLPSGGVDASNAGEYLRAGALAVYAGSSLTPTDVVEAGDLAEIGRRAASFVAALV